MTVTLNTPVPVSAALTEFLGLSAGTLLSRTDMKSGLCNYIREHQLQDPENKSFFVPDAKLKKLYLPDKYGYFKLYCQLNHHFEVAAVKIPTPPSAAFNCTKCLVAFTLIVGFTLLILCAAVVYVDCFKGAK